VTYPVESCEQTAFRLEELKAWTVLEKIMKKTPGVDRQTDPGLYFSLLLELQGNVGDDYVRRVNEQLDRAIEEQSSYGPRYQRLLADYYYKQGEHDQATIEYHKVLLLFEDNDQVPWARLGMARIYAANGLLTRARSIYEKITAPENPSIIREKARRWLEENS
jgi:tetratricopeptide (TPR) repeat protein